ncbi:hypothetical protein FQZ97_961110 [compost metagenome]
MQQYAIESQQHDDSDFRLQLRIEQIGQPLIAHVDPNDRDACNPEHDKCTGNRLLQAFHVPGILQVGFFTLEQFPDHGEVTG